MSIYEIGQFLNPILGEQEIVSLAFNRLKNRENQLAEDLLIALHCIDTYGTPAQQEELTALLEAEPLAESVLEYRMAA
jgi:hypothetical protein